GVVVIALALWKLRIVVFLLFLALTVAAAMRPGVESLAARRIPRAIGVLLHYVTFAALVGLFLWLLLPRALAQIASLLSPRILGGAVGLSPLLVMVSVFACGILFGPLAVILAIPAVSVLTTLVDVIARDRDPAEEDVPTVLFAAKEAEQ